jgi:hypothetical protein
LVNDGPYPESEERVGVSGAMEPTVPERARTVLSRATSAQVEWLDRSPGPNHASGASRLEVVEGQQNSAGRRVTVEIADAAALPVRERILSRLRVSGRAALDPGDATVLRLAPSAVSMEEAGAVVAVNLAEFLTVDPDPLACCEAALLSHLDSAHQDFVATLTSLVDSRHRYGVVRAWPLRLDRHGVVLRLEYARGHHDARLPFADAVRTPEEVRVQLHALVSEARRRRRACRIRGLARD